MMNTGIRVICERCGTVEFFTDLNDNDSNSEIKYMNSGWGRAHNKDLCPRCVEKYDKIINDFFNDVKVMKQ